MNNSEYEDREQQGVFVKFITDIKDNAAKQGIIITDDDIANRLAIPFSDYGKYRSTDSAPFRILQTLTDSFRAFTTWEFQIVSFETEHEVPDPPIPEGLDDLDE